MPQDFNRCVDEGGEVRTKDLPGGYYMHLCRDKNGKWHKGEVKAKTMFNHRQYPDHSTHD